MNVDCRWFSAHLDAFFCESLEPEDFRLASEHLKSCRSCRAEIQSVDQADPLIRQLLEYRMAKARAAAFARRRGFGFQLGLAGAAVGLVSILAFAVFIHEKKGPDDLPAIQTAMRSPISTNPGETKDETAAPTVRSKPDAPDRNLPSGNPVPEPSIPENAPEFQIIDPAGYSTSLQDYRGRVLFIGVWSADQPEAAQNLQRLYQAFGTRHEVRIIGVSSRNQERLAGTTFPMAFNNGSRLLETGNSNYVVVDKDGAVQMRGSLVGDPNGLVTKIRAKLDELGGR